MRKLLPAIGCVAVLSAACIAGVETQACAQQSAVAGEASVTPVLTVDEAVTAALANNRNVKTASLNLDATREQFLAAKTKRLPAFSTYVFGAELLTDVSFVIKKGQLGTFDATGPIPKQDVNLGNSSKSPTAYVVGQASQPLLTLYKVNLNLRGQDLLVKQAAQQVASARQTISASVHQAYYGVVQAEQAVEATQASIQQYQELDRITSQYVSEKTALKSESLQVKAKLAQQQLSLLQLQDKLKSGEETLNELLGRDINTQFRTAPVTEPSPEEGDLQAAQAKALLIHPQVKEAGLTVEQAEIQRRLAKAQYIPDLNLSFRYISPFGVNFLPQNIAAAGFEFSWDPFDWGARGHQLTQKTLVLEQSKQQLAETRAQILVNLDTQFRSLAEARLAVSVAMANREATHEKLRETTAQYGQKTALLRDVLQQQADAENADAQYNQAIASFWTAKANFRKAIGEE
ncbi:MAG: TolC family protein [Acidobacteriaceae bacterium]